MSLRSKLFSFEGRLRRRDWWALSLAAGISHLLCDFFAVRAVGLNLIEAGKAPLLTPGWLVMAGSSLPFMWPNLALAVKRAQDRGMAWFWAVALTLVLYVPTFARLPSGSPGARVLDLAVMVASFALLLLLGILDGTPGPNRYGSSPKLGVTVADVFT